MRSSEDRGYLTELADFVHREYGLAVREVSEANRGYYGETWRLDTTDRSYFAKLDYSPDHQPKFLSGLAVVDDLCHRGIDYVGRVVPTNEGRLRSQFHGADLGLFDWIDGENVESDDTKPIEYRLMAGIYAAAAAAQADNPLPIPMARFTTQPADSFRLFWTDFAYRAPDDADANDWELLALLRDHREMLNARADRLRHFAELCARDTSGFVLTHGDAGGNLLRVGTGDAARYAIVDWDEAQYAPPERDAWVMCQKDWAMQAFDDALAAAGLEYRLRPERLAYYCYQMLFFYLDELVKDHSTGNRLSEVRQLLVDGWIEPRLEWADAI